MKTKPPDIISVEKSNLAAKESLEKLEAIKNVQVAEETSIENEDVEMVKEDETVTAKLPDAITSESSVLIKLDSSIKLSNEGTSKNFQLDKEEKVSETLKGSVVAEEKEVVKMAMTQKDEKEPTAFEQCSTMEVENVCLTAKTSEKSCSEKVLEEDRNVSESASLREDKLSDNWDTQDEKIFTEEELRKNQSDIASKLVGAEKVDVPESHHFFPQKKHPYHEPQECHVNSFLERELETVLLKSLFLICQLLQQELQLLLLKYLQSNSLLKLLFPPFQCHLSENFAKRVIHQEELLPEIPQSQALKEDVLQNPKLEENSKGKEQISAMDLKMHSKELPVSCSEEVGKEEKQRIPKGISVDRISTEKLSENKKMLEGDEIQEVTESLSKIKAESQQESLKIEESKSTTGAESEPMQYPQQIEAKDLTTLNSHKIEQGTSKPVVIEDTKAKESFKSLIVHAEDTAAEESRSTQSKSAKSRSIACRSTENSKKLNEKKSISEIDCVPMELEELCPPHDTSNTVGHDAFASMQKSLRTENDPSIDCMPMDIEDEIMDNDGGASSQAEDLSVSRKVEVTIDETPMELEDLENTSFSNADNTATLKLLESNRKEEEQVLNTEKPLGKATKSNSEKVKEKLSKSSQDDKNVKVPTISDKMKISDVSAAKVDHVKSTKATSLKIQKKGISDALQTKTPIAEDLSKSAPKESQNLKASKPIPPTKPDTHDDDSFSSPEFEDAASPESDTSNLVKAKFSKPEITPKKDIEVSQSRNVSAKADNNNDMKVSERECNKETSLKIIEVRSLVQAKTFIPECSVKQAETIEDSVAVKKRKLSDDKILSEKEVQGKRTKVADLKNQKAREFAKEEIKVQDRKEIELKETIKKKEVNQKTKANEKKEIQMKESDMKAEISKKKEVLEKKMESGKRDSIEKKIQALMKEATEKKIEADKKETTVKKIEAEKKEAIKKTEADKKEATKKIEAEKKEATKKIEADKKEATKKIEADKREATKKIETDKKEVTKKIEADKKEAIKKIEADKKETTEKKIEADKKEAIKKIEADKKEATKKIEADKKEATKKNFFNFLYRFLLLQKETTEKKIEAGKKEAAKKIEADKEAIEKKIEADKKEATKKRRIEKKTEADKKEATKKTEADKKEATKKIETGKKEASGIKPETRKQANVKKSEIAKKEEKEEEKEEEIKMGEKVLENKMDAKKAVPEEKSKTEKKVEVEEKLLPEKLPESKTILSLSLDFEPPATIIKVNRRGRGRRSQEKPIIEVQENVQEQEEPQLEDLIPVSKIDKNQVVAEAQLTELLSKTEKKPPYSGRGRGRGRGGRRSLNVSVESDRKKSTRRLGLDIDESAIIDEDADQPVVRQSRRIAQLKIKEEAERRKLEEIALQKMKEEAMKKKKREQDDYVPSPVSATSESEDEYKKCLEKKKKGAKKRANQAKWHSGTGTSESDEKDEEEEEDGLEPEYIGSPLFKSDHEFSPESDLEDDSGVPTKMARTVRKDPEDDDDFDENPHHACQKCSKHDHPEWILLCDSCDKGYHCSCLKPVLFVIPEGDWFCPPCQHTKLLENLNAKLDELDGMIEAKEKEELKQQRLIFNTVSTDNILPEGAPEKAKSRSRSRSVKAKSSSSSSDDNSSDNEPIYKLRKRRQTNVSYRFNEYDDLINSAIKDEIAVMEEGMPEFDEDVSVTGAGNLGRGKDISTIIEADKEEKLRQLEAQNATKKESKKESDKSESETEVPAKADDSSDSEPIRPSGRQKIALQKKKNRKLNTLDISSEDDGSDEDFQESSPDSEDSAESLSSGSESSMELELLRKKNSKAGITTRRSVRSRHKVYDEDFINDNDSDEFIEPPTKKKRKKEESDFSDFDESDDDEDDEEEDLDSDDLCDDTDTGSDTSDWRSRRKKAPSRRPPKRPTEKSSSLVDSE
uniref:Uncharacterized protein n=1 Tax=Phlebotomus papatasi TaxID=29031 RepID=A0A1B0DLZ6_PHLPP